MKKRSAPRAPKMPDNAWDDDAPVPATKPAKPAKLLIPKVVPARVDSKEERKRVAKGLNHVKPPPHTTPAQQAARKRIDKAINGAEAEALIGGDIVGSKPAIDKPVVITNVALDAGAYMDRNSGTAIVVSTVRSKVQFLCMGASGIEYAEWPVEKFTEHYRIALPHYPIRRAARIYMQSAQPKDAKAQALLRGPAVCGVCGWKLLARRAACACACHRHGCAPAALAGCAPWLCLPAVAPCPTAPHLAPPSPP